ncbi:MAG: serine--tRNA ligase, partial [Gemmatimonadales bacterium]
MHDLRMVREQIDVLRDGMRRRGKLDTLAPVIDRAQQLDTERRTRIQAVEERKAARNSMSQEVARLKKSGGNADALLLRSR